MARLLTQSTGNEGWCKEYIGLNLSAGQSTKFSLHFWICVAKIYYLFYPYSKPLFEKFSVTEKVWNSGLGPDPDQSAKNGPELGFRSGIFFGMPLLRLNRLVPM